MASSVGRAFIKEYGPLLRCLQEGLVRPRLFVTAEKLISFPLSTGREAMRPARIGEH